MKDLIKDVLSSLQIRSIDYHSVSNLIQLNPLPPVLHIPSWHLNKKNLVEFLIFDFSLFAVGNAQDLSLKTLLQKKDIKTSINELLQSIEEETARTFPIPYPFFLLFAYEYLHQIENIPGNKDFYHLPEIIVAAPGNSIIVNHTNKTAFQIVPLKQSGIKFGNNKFTGLEHPHSISITLPKDEYIQKINTIRQLIFEGEVYQVNFTIRISSFLNSQPYRFFQYLYGINQAPYSFYLNAGEFHIISNSPERFIRILENQIETEPIKGTIPRGNTVEEDNQLMHKLKKSEKDLAELSMIVDLLRNDISKLCIPGSVQVIDHARIESYENVHHLVSTIKGNLKEEWKFLEILHATFPGGSITGCPKIAAMKYINELEPHNRSFYTGSFFIYYPLEKEMDSSILIRTAIVQKDKIHFQVGGGIVIDSLPEKEYEECMAKASSFLKALKAINQ